MNSTILKNVNKEQMMAILEQMDAKQMMAILIELDASMRGLKALQAYPPKNAFEKMASEVWKTTHVMSITDCLHKLGMDVQDYFNHNGLSIE